MLLHRSIVETRRSGAIDPQDMQCNLCATLLDNAPILLTLPK
jgi:hypothetical protein